RDASPSAIPTGTSAPSEPAPLRREEPAATAMVSSPSSRPHHPLFHQLHQGPNRPRCSTRLCLEHGTSALAQRPCLILVSQHTSKRLPKHPVRHHANRIPRLHRLDDPTKVLKRRPRHHRHRKLR